MEEDVLVVPRSVLFGGGAGFRGLLKEYKLLKKIAAHHLFVPRSAVEHNPAFKQVVTYLVLTCRGRVFLYQRQSSSREKRLVSRYSLGLGGHINPRPRCDFRHLVLLNLYRELEEEVALRPPFARRFLGLVNDDETPVGRHHVGLVFLVSCSSLEVVVREKEKISGAFVPAAALPSYEEQLESWSRLILPRILKELAPCLRENRGCGAGAPGWRHEP